MTTGARHTRAVPTRRYRVHGVVVETEAGHPAWPAAPPDAPDPWVLDIDVEAADVRDTGAVRTGPVQWEWSGQTDEISEVSLSGGPEPGSGAVYRICWPARRMEVRHWPPRPGALDDVLDLVAAWLLPRIARRERGCVALHAATVSIEGSGVVICGDSGSGKSTLTAAMVKAGAALVTDEPSLVEWQGAVPAVWPGAQRLRLLPGSAALADGWARQWDMGGKVAVAPVSAHLVGAATPVRAVVLLGGRRPAHEATQVRRLDPTDALVALMSQRFVGGVAREEARADFPRTARLAGAVPVLEARLPDDVAALPDAVAALLLALP